MKDSDTRDAWLQIDSPMIAPCTRWGSFGFPYNSLVFLRLAFDDAPWNGKGPGRQVGNLTVIANPL